MPRTGAPRQPRIERHESATALVNDPALTARVSAAFVRELGQVRVQDALPEMATEDFSEFEKAGIPTLMLRVGAVEPQRFAAARDSGASLPSLYSARFAPDYRVALATATAAEVTALRELLQ